jgi:hypothetical protein
LTQMAIDEENDDFARKRLVQAEREFLHCISDYISIMGQNRRDLYST